MTANLDHETTEPALRVELFVRDVARSITFYRDVLQFELLRQAPSGYVSLGRQGAVLGLNPMAHIPSDHPAHAAPDQACGLGVELVLVVEDIATAHTHARAAGGLVTELVEQPWGLRDFRITDPDGCYLRLTGRRCDAVGRD